tara:strand:- start:11 stop:289 length:279 start_codon:yes stop_codon:yes gene_type:complete
MAVKADHSVGSTRYQLYRELPDVNDLQSVSPAPAPSGAKSTIYCADYPMEGQQNAGRLGIEDGQQSFVAKTEDDREAVTAFLEKRKPTWRDR